PRGGRADVRPRGQVVRSGRWAIAPLPWRADSRSRLAWLDAVAGGWLLLTAAARREVSGLVGPSRVAPGRRHCSRRAGVRALVGRRSRGAACRIIASIQL